MGLAGGMQCMYMYMYAPKPTTTLHHRWKDWHWCGVVYVLVECIFTFCHKDEGGHLVDPSRTSQHQLWLPGDAHVGRTRSDLRTACLPISESVR